MQGTVHGLLRALARIVRGDMRVRHIEVVCNCNKTILILFTHKTGETPRLYTCPHCKRVVDLQALLKDVHMLVGWTVE